MIGIPDHERHARQQALVHAMHMADIVATHNDKEVSPGFVVDAAKEYYAFLIGEKE